jgi:cell division protein FtsN
MARDYKNAGKRKKPQRKPVPGWIWMVTGLSVGLLVALLVYLKGHEPPAGTRTAVLEVAPKHTKQSPPAPTKAKTASAAKPDKTKSGTQQGKQGLHFEFYTLLPESEVVIPEDEAIPARTKEGKPKTTPTGTYMLQAGSFRNEDEAKTLKGELALLGIVANIQSVVISGDTWHRVWIGPFGTAKDVDDVQRRLRNNDITAIRIRVKG